MLIPVPKAITRCPGRRMQDQRKFEIQLQSTDPLAVGGLLPPRPVAAAEGPAAVSTKASTVSSGGINNPAQGGNEGQRTQRREDRERRATQQGDGADKGCHAQQASSRMVPGPGRRPIQRDTPIARGCPLPLHSLLHPQPGPSPLPGNRTRRNGKGDTRCRPEWPRHRGRAQAGRC